MSINRIITDKIVFGGSCLSKIDGKNVFVPYAIPGEELEVEIISEKRDYSTAKIVNILKPSEYRVKSPCPYYEKCGGCNLMHIDENYQKEIRKDILKTTFLREGVELPEIQVVSGSNLNYRSRFQFSDGGLSEKSSNNSIKLSECLVAEDAVNDWLKKTAPEDRPAGRCHVFGSSHVVSVSGNSEKKVAVSSEVSKAPEARVSKKTKNYREIKKHYSGTVLSEDNIVTVELLGKKISFDVRGFFQSNLEVLEKSIQEVVRGLVGSTVLDMYAGCGTFSVFLTDFFEKVTLVEHNRDALVFAEQNLAGKNHESIGLSGAKWAVFNKNQRYDAVVIDPPRSGMEKEVLDYLCEAKIPQVRSVSCDPATHARDAARLLKAGYKIEKAFLLDFYPNTSHIESLIWFTHD